MQSDTTGSLQEFHKILEEAGKKGASDIHYVPKEQLSSTCINNQDRLRSSALLLFETSLLMEKVPGCLVEPVVNFSLS